MIRVQIGDERDELTWEDWEDRVRSGRIPTDALVCFPPVTGDTFVRAADLEFFQSLQDDERRLWQQRFSVTGPPIITALLVGIQIRIWWFARLPSSDEWVAQMLNWAPPQLEKGEIWRVFSSGLLHTDLWHIAMNAVYLAYCGWILEKSLGRANTALLFFAAVFGGGIPSMWFTPESPSLGSSGGVFGLVAATAVFGFIRRDIIPARHRSYFWVVIPFLVMSFLSGLASEQVDNWAHGGGLVTGVILAALLDPPTLERRRGWNRTIQVGLCAGMVASFLAILFAGPTLIPTHDHRWSIPIAPGRKAPTELPDAQLTWDVPTYWVPGSSSSGAAGYQSPQPEHQRFFGARERKTDRPRTAEELLDEWSREITSRYAGTRLGAPTTFDLQGGVTGLGRAAFVLGEEGPTVIVQTITTRGRYILETTSEVDTADADHLDALLARLRSMVTWSEPAGLTKARKLAASRPRSNQTRRDVGQVLLDFGVVDAALSVWLGLVEVEPENPDNWRGLLKTVRWYPGQVEDARSLWTQALAQHPEPATVVEVALGLESDEAPEEASALLRLAWRDRPGDRLIGAALRKRGLSTRLDEQTALPWGAVYEPTTGERRATPLPSRPLSLDEARRFAEETRALRSALWQRSAELLEVGDPRAGIDLAILKYGYRPPGAELPLAIESAVDELSQAADGVPVTWVPTEAIPTWKRLRAERPGLRELLVFSAEEVASSESGP